MSNEREMTREELERQVPKIETLVEARQWIQIHHRWLKKDSAEFVRLADRIRFLEQPWWRRLGRRRLGR